MKITDVRLEMFKWPRHKPITNGLYTYTHNLLNIVVIETDEGDAIVIRSMCYLALTFDHRLVDGAVADQFMAYVRQIIEEGQYSL